MSLWGENLFVFLKKIFADSSNMNFKILIAIIIVFFASGFSVKVFASSDNQLITELLIVDNDTTFRKIFYYDNLGNLALETKFYKKNESWIRLSQIEWVQYLTKSKMQIERIWINDSWKDVFVHEYEYLGDILNTETQIAYNNGIALPIKKIAYKYKGDFIESKSESGWFNNAWKQTIKTEFFSSKVMNSDSIITSVFQQDTVSKQYLSVQRFNETGFLVSNVTKERTGNVDWINKDSVNWYYNPSSKLVTIQRNKKWSTQYLNWENAQNIIYEYDVSNKIVTETYQKWNFSFWENIVRYINEYNSDGQLILKSDLLPIYNSWRSIKSIKYSDFVNSKPNFIESFYDFWGGNTGELTESYIPFMFNNEMVIPKAKSLKIGYLSVTDTTNSTNQVAQFQPGNVYPNPSNGIFYIDNKQHEIFPWIVTDLNGRILKKNDMSRSTNVIDLTNLPRGIYLLRDMTSEIKTIQKLIKE